MKALLWLVLCAVSASMLVACGTVAPPGSPTPDREPTAPTTEHKGDCLSALDLVASADGQTAYPVLTSYRCDSLYVDSTRYVRGDSTLVVPSGAALIFRFQPIAGRAPAKVEIRVYPGTGSYGSFFFWPEDLVSKGLQPVDRASPSPASSFVYSPNVQPGTYSLVIRATWDEPVDAFYVLGLTIQ